MRALPDARCGVGAPVLRGRSRAAAARAAAARAAAAREAVARAAESARAATRRCTPPQARGGVLFRFAAEPPGGSARSRGGGAEVLSAAMSRRARPGGEAGGPRRSQLGCRRRAHRRTALLEMGVPPIEPHGGGGRRVGKRKIRSGVGFSETRSEKTAAPALCTQQHQNAGSIRLMIRSELCHFFLRELALVGCSCRLLSRAGTCRARREETKGAAGGGGTTPPPPPAAAPPAALAMAALLAAVFAAVRNAAVTRVGWNTCASMLSAEKTAFAPPVPPTRLS